MESLEVILSWKKLGPGVRESLMVTGSLLAVTILALLWVLFMRRKRRRRHRSHGHDHSRAASPEPAAVESADAGPSRKRRKWRRRRREHRPMNPTLAETGGLPPVRREDRPDPST